MAKKDTWLQHMKQGLMVTSKFELLSKLSLQMVALRKLLTFITPLKHVLQK